MSTSLVKRQVEPHWLMRLLGAKPVIFHLLDSELRIETGRRDRVAAESLYSCVGLKRGIVFSTLRLRTDQGVRIFRGLEKNEARSLFYWLRAYSLAKLAPDISLAAADIKNALAKGYPRQSRVEHAMWVAKAAVERFGEVPPPEQPAEVGVSQFSYTAEVARWKKKDLRRLQCDYVSKQLTKYESFFDQVESKPLTLRQREVCVVDEDNNLVLAGAGTGKTSVMVGRAGYLIESGQARPDEILMLAFGSKAASEMQGRITLRLGNCGVTASTFHKIGKDIVAAVEGCQPSVTPLADDDRLLAAHVNAWYEAHMLNPAYRTLAIKYFEEHMYPDANPFDFDSEGAYFDYIIANDIRTLKGEAVKSLGECLVANHLFRRGINYQYEAPYEHDTGTLQYRQYQPDFYLPDYGIYIEYYGVDRNGNTAPYVNRVEYEAGMCWKRALHAEHGTPLIELFHYEHMEGTLLASIDEQLDTYEVACDPLPPEAILATLREFGAVDQFASLLSDFLKRYRANCYEPGQVEAAISVAENSTQVNAALKLLTPIIEDYQALLDSTRQIDFDDMIAKAIRYVRQGRFKGQWKYILVDEFQDISEARARLVKLLRDSADECSLFCVGDDWQAIYRFAGSDLTFTTDFESFFGTTRTTALDLTFRFNNGIGDVAAKFVQRNPLQMKKELHTLREVSGPTVSIMRATETISRASLGIARIETVLSRISQIAVTGSTVYLLGRYGFNLPSNLMMNKLRRQYPQLSLDAHTMHGAKGMEADYVVLLGLETGKHGFPSEKVTNPLFEALLPPLEKFAHAEERRLFYVALTRAKHRVYLIADMAVASEFVVELLQSSYKIELDEFEASIAQKLFQLIKCMKCKTGTMVPRQSEHGAFFGCNKYPLCSHKERGCQTCGSQMRRAGRFKVCISPECDTWVPICPECGAEMTARKGRYGYFWGCRNFRHGGAGCSHTEKEITFDEILISESE